MAKLIQFDNFKVNASSVDNEDYYIGSSIDIEANTRRTDEIRSYSFFDIKIDDSKFLGREIEDANIRFNIEDLRIEDYKYSGDLERKYYYVESSGVSDISKTNVDYTNELIESSFSDHEREYIFHTATELSFDVGRSLKKGAQVFRIRPDFLDVGMIFRMRLNTENTTLRIWLKDIIPSKPTGLTHSDQSKSSPITLKWDYNTDSEFDKQTKFDLEYSIDGQNFKTITQNSDISSYTFPAKFFEAGTVTYRVRTYSIDNAASEWSDLVECNVVNIYPDKPNTSNISPKDTILYGQNDIPLTWEFKSPAQGDSQVAYRIGYSYDNLYFTEIEENSTISRHILESTFVKEGEIYWKVRTKGNDGVWSDWSDTVTFDVVYRRALKPTGLTPDNAILDKASEITCFWTYNSSVPKEDHQTKFDIAYSIDNVTFKEISQVSNIPLYKFPTNFFSLGKVYWKIRTYSVDNIASQWSDVAILNIAGKPNTPIIISSINFNVARPFIEWIADGQEIAEITILQGNNVIYEREIVDSIAREHRIEKTLKNGKTYAVKIRIKNIYGLWSDVVSKVFSVSYTQGNPSRIVGMVNNINASVLLRISNTEGNIRKNIIYRRDYKTGIWHKLTEISKDMSEYIDDTATSDIVYAYKIVTIADNYAEINSNIINIKVKVRNTIISNNNDFVELKYNPEKTLKFNTEVQTSHFLGRSKRVAEFGDFEDCGIDLKFFISDYKKIEKLIYLIKSKQVLRLRDSRGKNIIGIINNLDIQDLKKYKWVVRFSFVEVEG